MSLNDPKARYDGFQAITSGVDSGRSPSVLGQNQLSWLINGTTRGGFVQCRPGLRQRPLKFLSSTFETDTAVETNFETKLFQGAGGYVSDQGHGYILASIGGRIFRTEIDQFETTDLTGTDLNSAQESQSWFCQAENYLIIQNGHDRPFIFDGANIRRSSSYENSGGKEVPTCTAMEYHNGRLWGIKPDRRSFVSGDLAYSVTNSRSDVLTFTENTFLGGGGAFSIPMQAGVAVALRSVAVQDSVAGQGPLQVFTTRGVFSVNAPFNRDEWASTTSPIQTISLLAAGAVAQDSTVQVNGDLWFRSPDGVRSFVIARRDHGTWVNTPVSMEVDRVLRHDTPELLEYGSGALFDNRLLMTTQPRFMVDDDGVNHGVVHRGLVVVDFANVSHMLNRAQPVWDGLWTGLNILKLVTVDTPAKRRLFAFALNEDYEIELWEVTTDDRFDATDSRIDWVIETPLYGFDTGGWNLRQLGYGDLWINRLAGQVDMTVKYRPDYDPQWQSWAEKQFCAKYRDCSPAVCSTPVRYLEQYRSRVRLPEASGTCDTVTGKPRDYGYRFAVRIEVSGFCQIPQFRIVGRDMPEDVTGGCDDTTCTEAGIADTCATNDFAYSIPLQGASEVEAIWTLQDPDTLLWYNVSISHSDAEGYWFSIDPDPVSAGTAGEWILQDDNGIRYSWSVSMTDDGLILKNFGITSDAETEVVILAGDETERTVAVGLDDGGEPYLRII